jgi:lysophospholipase L1-like esterase
MVSPLSLIARTLLYALAALCLPCSAAIARPASNGAWLPAYLSSPCAPIVGVPAEVIPPPQEIQGTVRYRITLGAGGRILKLRLTNEVGNKPLKIGHVTLMVPGAKTDKFVDVTFGGSTATVIPPGAPALSDPVQLPVKAGKDVIVSVYFPERFTHTQADGLRPTHYSKGADQAAAAELAAPTDLFVRPIVSGVFVLSDTDHREAIVTLGDSITDGTGARSTEVRGWPEHLSARIGRKPASRAVVANAGISGNKLLSDGWGISALGRFDRDVLAMPSVKYVILLEGVNDIGSPGVDGDTGVAPGFEDLLGAYRQLIGRAHQKNVKMICGTILPFGGSSYFSDAKEHLRTRVNAWIRTSGECDGVIDFDKAMGEPGNPQALRAQFDSGDHLHPNDTGYLAMAEAIDLSLFR